jgi:site-specific recombinase XerD
VAAARFHGDSGIAADARDFSSHASISQLLAQNLAQNRWRLKFSNNFNKFDWRRDTKGLRHSFGLHAIRSGVPLNLVQRWLGHASMNTTAIYLQAIGDEEREIAARMWHAP